MNIKGKVLITGGCGFIGSHLVKKLIQLGADITVFDIFLDPRSFFAQDNIKQFTNLQKIDIRNREKTIKTIKKINPTYIIHLAAEPIVEDAYLNPHNTLETNIMGTVNVLDATRLLNNIKGIIVASSDKAYGKNSKAYKEDMPLKGDHPYDVSKSCQDLIAQTYHKTYDLPIVITRFGNVYGEGDLHFGRIVPDICKSVIQNKPLLIRSNGKLIRDYIYAQDVVSGYIFLLNKVHKMRGEAFNFSSTDNLSVIRLVQRAEKILKVKIPIQILNKAKNEIPYQHLNCEKIKKLGWKQNHTLENSLGQTLNWYKTLKSFSS